jgi:phosphohistidine phosphatase SixA
MIVGHEPQLSELVALALTGASTRLHVELKKGSCVAIAVDGRLDRGESVLLWMLTQRQLRKLGK